VILAVKGIRRRPIAQIILIRIIGRVQRINSGNILIGEPVAIRAIRKGMLQAYPGIEKGNDRGVRYDGILCPRSYC